MTKTCIVCGKAAGSKEHVFPAALGGRRTNSGIYCAEHDNSYSGLVCEIAGQLDVFNAYLGVCPDHSGQPKTAYGQHTLTGETLAISANGIRFTRPRLISRRPTGDGETITMGFPDQLSLKAFTQKMADQGPPIALQSKPTSRPYITGTIHHRLSCGGPCGLGAMAYLAQTFFAQEFPEIARSNALSDFIAYTQAIAKVAALGGCEQKADERAALTTARVALAAALTPFGGAAPIWWDCAPPTDTRPNRFEFGHRVTVGVDGTDGQIYGRVALFSTLRFAMRLGSAPGQTAGREVTIDIDPLAPHPPHDIEKHQVLSAPHRVDVPQQLTAGLSAAIADGTQQRALAELLGRLTEYQLTQQAHHISLALEPCSSLSPHQARALIDQVLDQQLQLVWHLVTDVIQGLKSQMVQDGLEAIFPMLDQLIAHDAQSVSGLSRQAEMTLVLAKAALAAQMAADSAVGVLDETRIAELMGRGPGLCLVGQAVLAPVVAGMQSTLAG